MSNHTEAKAIDSTAIDHSTCHSLHGRNYNTVLRPSKDLVVVYMKQLLPIGTRFQIT